MPSRSHAPSYAAVLRTPSCARLFTAALVGRLSYGTVSLSLVLALTAATRSYAAAGVVMALFGLAVSFLSPARAGLIDRYGWRRALPPMAIAYAGLLLLIAASTWRPGASQVALGVLAVAAGACAPPLGPVMRSLWNDLLPDRRLLQRAYSLDMVAEELLFVTGPLLAGLLANVAVPSAGLVLSAALVLTGTLALVRSPDAGPDTRAGGGGPPEATVARIPRRRLMRSVMGLGLPMATAAVAGIGLGALSLVILAFAQQRHQTAAVALAEAALAAGSAVGGLAYGTVAWRGSARVRLRVLGAGLGLAIAVAGLAPNLYALVAILAIAGLFVAPVLSTAYLVADESASPGQRVRAGAWVNTAFNAGSSAGTAAFGLLIGRLPLALCFVVAGAPAVVSAATAVGRTRRHCPTHPRGCGNIQR
ncbi:MAG: hypothetical protein JWO67_4092 [Streptosporangiaceae bacterium]|nr:hypothetical protein [Streptosporangiaceae bacterium]